MLSVAIICRDNESTIGRTLESIAGLADEIVAADSGSTDGTIALLERHNARVIRTEWKGYVATKQIALDACTQPWILCLDSDESVEPELRRSIEQVMARDDPGVAGCMVNRKVYYRGRPLRFAWQPEHRLRLVRRGRARWVGLDPHDALEIVPAPDPAGAPVIARADAQRAPILAGDLRHDAIGTWPEFMAKQARHAAVMAQSMRRHGARCSVLRLVFSPPGAFLKQIVLKQAWRDGWPGWVAAAATAAAAIMKHAALLELGMSDSSEGDFPADGA
jgi:glycosyltransferase involved in cell wall biosynthesis